MAAHLPALLREAPFRGYWAGRTLSQLGDQIRGLALPLTAVTALHAGGTAMGLLSAAGTLPSLAFALHAGAFVDRRGGRRQIMLWADLGRAALVAAVPALWAARRLSLPVLLALAFAIGVLSVLFRVASGTLFVALVPKERYVEASALLTQGRAGAFLAGPALGGALIQFLSAPVALLADGLSFLASALSLARIRPEEPPPAMAGRGELLQGVSAAWRSPILRGLWLSGSVTALFKWVFMALYVLYMTRDLHITPAEMGLILGPSSIGAVASALAVRSSAARFGVGPTLVAGTALYTLPMLAVPLAGGPHALVVALLFAVEGTIAAGLMAMDVATAAIQATAIADEVRSRVLGAFALTTTGLAPVGALLAALGSAAFGVHAAIAVAAAGSCLGVAALFPAVAGLRRLEDTALGEEGAAVAGPP